MMRGGVITGLVTNAKGEPVVGVPVHATMVNAPASITNFSLEQVSPKRMTAASIASTVYCLVNTPSMPEAADNLASSPRAGLITTFPLTIHLPRATLRSRFPRAAVTKPAASTSSTKAQKVIRLVAQCSAPSKQALRPAPLRFSWPTRVRLPCSQLRLPPSRIHAARLASMASPMVNTIYLLTTRQVRPRAPW